MSELIEERDKTLFNKIVNDPDHVLYDLLPVKRLRVLRERGHPLILPKIKTERFKRTFLNRCLFDYFLGCFNLESITTYCNLIFLNLVKPHVCCEAFFNKDL